MGHSRVSSKQAYLDLQKRLNDNVTGAPASPTFMKILKLLYTPREAELAAHLPTVPTSLEKLARELDVPARELDKQLTAMAQRGVVIDLSRGDKRYFSLPPVVITAAATSKKIPRLSTSPTPLPPPPLPFHF